MLEKRSSSSLLSKTLLGYYYEKITDSVFMRLQRLLYYIIIDKSMAHVTYTSFSEPMGKISAKVRCP